MHRNFSVSRPHRSMTPGMILQYTASDSGDISVRELYYKTLCLAKYFFFTDAYGFVRNCRPDQVRVQLFGKKINPFYCFILFQQAAELLKILVIIIKGKKNHMHRWNGSVFVRAV